MKKILLTLLLIFFVKTFTYTQTYQSELKRMSERYDQGNLDIYKYQKMAKHWNELVKKYSYPEIPYDTIKSKHQYQFIFSFDSISKSIIYNRILEKMSMESYSLSDVLDYQDYNLGKMIFSISNTCKFPDNSGTITYQCKYRFIVIENKVKFEIFNLSFISSNGVNSIEQLYPISDSNEAQWDIRFKLLNAIDKDIRKNSIEILHFIQNYQEDYKF